VLLTILEANLSELGGQHSDLVLLNNIFVAFGLHPVVGSRITPQFSLLDLLLYVVELHCRGHVLLLLMVGPAHLSLHSQLLVQLIFAVLAGLGFHPALEEASFVLGSFYTGIPFSMKRRCCAASFVAKLLVGSKRLSAVELCP
jgi:hypothetical protein